jgi:type I restriction enzyme R subunit
MKNKPYPTYKSSGVDWLGTGAANPLDRFELGVDKMLNDLILQRMADNDAIVTRYMEDDAFKKAVHPILMKQIYKDILAGV